MVFLFVGWRLRNAGVTLVGFLTLPVLAHVTGQPAEVVWACAAMFALIVIKRLEANREPLPTGPERWRVLLCRLLLDRDIEDWETWAHRHPETKR